MALKTPRQARRDRMASERAEPTRAPAGGRGLAYLQRPTPLMPLPLLMALYGIFLFAAHAETALVFLALIAFVLADCFAAPRWVAYAALGIALVLVAAQFVFTHSTGPQDPNSIRDEAAEVTTQAFLSGENPWRDTELLKAPPSTGPASILLAAPAVLIFHRINELTFAFYLVFFTYLLTCDMRHENETFPTLGLLILLGSLGFDHTLYWSLEELYYGYAALVLGWCLLERRRPFAAGLCVAFALCVRASYAYPVLGFLGWYVHSDRYTRAHAVALVAGAGAGTALILLPFAFVAGADLLTHNPLRLTQSLLSNALPDTNVLFSVLNRVGALAGPMVAGALKAGLAVLVLWFVCRSMAGAALPHPFWHLCLGGFVADLLVYRATIFNDYVLFFVVPGLLALAHAESPLALLSIPHSSAVRASLPPAGRRQR